MPIEIQPTSKKDVQAFAAKAWHGEDIEHYGQRVEWKQRSFRFKATEGDQILGIINGKCEPGVLYIYGLIVDSDERGKGVGRALLTAAEEFGLKCGAHKVTLDTGENWKAREFYESMGYTVEATLPNHYFHVNFVTYTKFIR